MSSNKPRRFIVLCPSYMLPSERTCCCYIMQRRCSFPSFHNLRLFLTQRENEYESPAARPYDQHSVSTFIYLTQALSFVPCTHRRSTAYGSHAPVSISTGSFLQLPPTQHACTPITPAFPYTYSPVRLTGPLQRND